MNRRGLLQLAAGGVTMAFAQNPRLYMFSGGRTGAWEVLEAKAITGEALAKVEKIDISIASPPQETSWILRGVTSNERYVDRNEKASLSAKQQLLGRKEATYGALIPIRKNAKWWSLTQEDRRAIFESQSHHIDTGLKYLPAVARRLHHCRDLGENQPFDFITLFDYAKDDAGPFDEMVAALRATEEWKYVDREFDIRMRRIT